jgi:hypothetical protein
MEISIHPAAGLFPPLSEPELDRLADEIGRHGLRRPIVLYQGAVLDGRGRLEACRRAGVEPQFTQWDGAGSPLEWLVSENASRRHLGHSQRAMIALELMPLLEAEARQGLRARRGRPQKRAHQCAHFSEKGAARGKLTEAAARLVGVSARYVQVARRIARVFPALLPAIIAGKINLVDAQRAARLSGPRRLRLLHALADETAPEEDLDVRRMLRATCDLKLGRRVREPSGPRLIITDEELRAIDQGAAVTVFVAGRECLLLLRAGFSIVTKRCLLPPSDSPDAVIVPPRKQTAASGGIIQAGGSATEI